MCGRLLQSRPSTSQRRYCTTKREMLAAVSMCIQFRSYLRGAKFTLHTDHKSLVCLHRFKDTKGMMVRWLHALQQFQFSIVHRPSRDHGNADGLSRVLASTCRQCTSPDCPLADVVTESIDQLFDSESTGSSEDSDLVPYTPERTGWHCWTMTCHNRLQFPVISSRYLPYRKKIQSASHPGRGLRQATSHRGPRSRVYAQS